MNKDQFEKVTKWQDEVFTKATSISCYNHLKEEVEELGRDLRDGVSSPLEIADCFLLLFGICNKEGMKYEDVVNAINDKMEINMQRSWGKVNQQGYVKHL